MMGIGSVVSAPENRTGGGGMVDSEPKIHMARIEWQETSIMGDPIRKVSDVLEPVVKHSDYAALAKRVEELEGGVWEQEMADLANENTRLREENEQLKERLRLLTSGLDAVLYGEAEDED
jgi:hypothetical protein